MKIAFLLLAPHVHLVGKNEEKSSAKAIFYASTICIVSFCIEIFMGNNGRLNNTYFSPKLNLHKFK